MKLLKSSLILLTIFTVLFIATCNAEEIQGTVQHDGNYYYVSFGDYSNFNYYNDLKKYLKNDYPKGLTKDDNPIGFHMTIKNENLQNGSTLKDIQGEEYSFNTENSFTEFKTDSKDWFVKKLTPLDNAKDIFKDAYHATLHASVAYVEHNKDNLYQMHFVNHNHNKLANAVNI